MTARARRPVVPAIDILAQSPLWQAEPSSAAVIRAAVDAAAREVRIPARAELTVVLADDDAIRVLNKTWRHKDAPTNVLSFPFGGPKPAGNHPLGDIVLAYETLKREAGEGGLAFDHHLAHLTVHGLLHLVGYDHEEEAAAETMEDTERRALAHLSIPDPYGAQVRDG